MTQWPQWLAGTGLVTIGRHDPVGQGHDPEGRLRSSPRPLWSAIDRARGSVAPRREACDAERKQRATQPRNDAIARAASRSACSGRASQPIHPSSIVGVDPLRADSR